MKRSTRALIKGFRSYNKNYESSRGKGITMMRRRAVGHFMREDRKINSSGVVRAKYKAYKPRPAGSL